MGFEDSIKNNFFNSNSEKTFIDKLLARQDVDKMRELVKKQDLDRSDLKEIEYMLSSPESKLYNFSEWERYIVEKYHIWICRFIQYAELLFDFKTNYEKEHMQLSDHAKKMLDNNIKMSCHIVKFVVNVYLNITRTSLSLGGMGFLELLKNKFEMLYNQQNVGVPVQTEKQSMFNLGGKKQ